MKNPNSPEAREIINSYKEAVKEFDKVEGTRLYQKVNKLLKALGL